MAGPEQERIAALVARAVGSYRAGWALEAERLARRALDLDPDEPTALHLVGTIARTRGDAAAALVPLHRLAGLRARDQSVWCELGLALASTGAFATAEATLRRAATMGPPRRDISEALGELLMLQGRYDEAAAICADAEQAGVANPAVLRLLGHAQAGAGRLDEARETHYRMTGQLGGLFARTLPVDRLISDGKRDEAAAAFTTLKSSLHAAELARPRPRLTQAAPIAGIAIDRTNWLSRLDPAEIAAAAGVPVWPLDLAQVSTPLRTTGPVLFLYPVSLGQCEYETIRRLSQLYPGHPVAAWLFDNHTAWLNSYLIAQHCDVVVPAHRFAANYLEAPTLWAPLCVTQWSGAELAAFWAASAGVPRADRLHGRFSYYPLARRRNRLIAAVRAALPESDVALDYHTRPYHALAPRERFAAWRSFKVSLHLPVAEDLSMRVFDALAAGHVPIVSDTVRDLDDVIPPADQAALPIIRLADESVAAVRAAHEAALAAFDAGREDAAQRRHDYVRGRHLLAHRVAAILAGMNRMLQHP
jgi:cytochrome c-type biogenesis protein CcmH/NrfG